MAEALAQLIAELKENETLERVKAELAAGSDPMALVESLREGMGVIGERFEKKEYFLADLIMSAEIFSEAIALIEPHLAKGAGPTKGAIVLGTVHGDIHDIGKNIIGSLLKCDGYDVHDLGVDVPPAAFVAKVKETGAKVVALSGLLTLAFDAMRETVDSLKEAGLRDQVKVIIGGGPVNQAVVDYSGADAFGKDATAAMKLAAEYVG